MSAKRFRGNSLAKRACVALTEQPRTRSELRAILGLSFEDGQELMSRLLSQGRIQRSDEMVASVAVTGPRMVHKYRLRPGIST